MCTSRQLAGILARFSLLIRPFESKLNGKDVLLFIGEVSDNPQWVQVVLDRFDSKTEPQNEVEIAQELANERALHGNLSEEDWKAFLAEHSAFFFVESREGAGAWGTYFAPMAEWTQGETTVRNLDITQLNNETVAYWEQRGAASKNPLMKARYARPSMGSREGDCQHPAKLPVRTHGSRRACRGDGADRSPFQALNLFAGQRSAGDCKKHPAPE
jgi:hypothetical protein